MIQTGGVYTTFCQEEGVHLQKHRNRKGRRIAILFKSVGVKGRFDSPDCLLLRLQVYLSAIARSSTAAFSHGKNSQCSDISSTAMHNLVDSNNHSGVSRPAVQKIALWKPHPATDPK